MTRKSASLSALNGSWAMIASICELRVTVVPVTQPALTTLSDDEVLFP